MQLSIYFSQVNDTIKSWGKIFPTFAKFTVCVPLQSLSSVQYLLLKQCQINPMAEAPHAMGPLLLEDARFVKQIYK